MSEQFQKAVRDADLISAGVSGVLASVLLSYAAHATRPGIIHALVALVAVGAIVGAYLFAARSKVEGEWKVATIVGGGVVSLLCLWLLSAAN